MDGNAGHATRWHCPTVNSQLPSHHSPVVLPPTPQLTPPALIVHEAFANRAQDWMDIEGVIVRQRGRLLWGRLESDLRVLVALKEEPGILSHHEATMSRAEQTVAFAENGVSIRPRGFALDVSGLAAGDYTLSVLVDRHGTTATSAPREFTIVGR